MKNNNGCKHRRCGCIKMARGYWDNFPYYGGPCPDTDGCYGYIGDNCSDNCSNNCSNHCDCDCNDTEVFRGDRCRCRRRCGGRHCCGIFQAYLPMALSANGIIPLAVNNPCRDSSFDVNSGMITLEKAGTYLASYSVRTPAAAEMDTTITLNVNDASQASAVSQIVTEAGQTTSSYNAQAIFQADEGATVALRTSDAINVTETSIQPMFTLSLVQIDE